MDSQILIEQGKDREHMELVIACMRGQEFGSTRMVLNVLVQLLQQTTSFGPQLVQIIHASVSSRALRLAQAVVGGQQF